MSTKVRRNSKLYKRILSIIIDKYPQYPSIDPNLVFGILPGIYHILLREKLLPPGLTTEEFHHYALEGFLKAEVQEEFKTHH